ncbi:MAG: ATP-binding protein [Nitrospirota bacterium]
MVNALKSLSGTYALQLFEDDHEQNQKTIAIGVTLHYLLQSKEREGNFLLIPVYCHPDIFDDAVNLCDFLLISVTQQSIKITCIDSAIEAELSFRSSILEKTNERFLKTEKLFHDKYFSSQQEESEGNIGAPLERSRLVMLLRYYLSKAVRYNLIDKEGFGKFSELLSKVEAGKIQLNILKRAYLISPGEDKYKIEPSYQDEIKVTILGRHVLSEPPQPLDYGKQIITGSYEELPLITEEQNREEEDKEILAEQPSDIGGIKTDEVDGADIPSYPESVEIILGKSVTDENVVWKPSVKGSPHVFILGIPGQGKSVTINTLLVELQRNGIGTLTFDFHGQFSDTRNAFRKSCMPTIWNAAEGLPFSPFEADLVNEIGQQSWKTQSFALADIFAYVCELGDIQKDGVFRAISACYKDTKNRGDNTFPTINDLEKKIERLENKKEIRNVLAKCRPLLEMNIFNPQVFEKNWDILESTKKGLVINIKEIGSETVQLAISAFVLRKVYKEILKWEESYVLKLAIVLDEAHRLAKDKTLPLIMQEARKFGVLVIVASQNINHFHENVLGNAGTKILFRTNNPDSKKVSKMVQMRSSSNAQSIIEQLRTGQAVVQTPDISYAAKTMMRKFD